MTGGEEELQQLRSRATELLFKQDWKEYIKLYTHFIDNSSAGAGALQHSKSLPSALSNRADARYRLKDLPGALRDCNSALDLDPGHLKSLVSKGRILLDLDCYSGASECFQLALALERSDLLRELLDRCKRLELQSGTGAVDLSDWLASGFAGKPPELAEYVGPVEIRRPEGTGRRGLFLTRNVEAGTVLLITKPVVIGRAILPESGADSARMVMWKDFVDRILEATERSGRTLYLLYMLSTGEEEDETSLVVPDMGLFRPGIIEEDRFSLGSRAPDVRRIVKVLDVNCLSEEAASSKVLGRTTSGCCGVGLWVLPSFVNHSCCPNARRAHVGDTVVVHASRDLRAGEEVTFAYFDVLLPLGSRRELAKKWGFECGCERCRFEEGELQVLDCGSDLGEFVIGVEESMKRRTEGRKERGFLRASHWGAYSGVYESGKMMRRWGRRIPAELVVAESVADAVGGDERVLKAVLGSLKKKGGGGGGIGGCGGVVEMERMMRMGRGVYGKVAKKNGMRALFELLAQ